MIHQKMLKYDQSLFTAMLVTLSNCSFHWLDNTTGHGFGYVVNSTLWFDHDLPLKILFYLLDSLMFDTVTLKSGFIITVIMKSQECAYC